MRPFRTVLGCALLGIAMFNTAQGAPAADEMIRDVMEHSVLFEAEGRTRSASTELASTRTEPWWPGWGDTGLNETLHTALKQNAGLEAARARAQGAKAGSWQAKSALLPQIDLNLSSSASPTDSMMFSPAFSSLGGYFDMLQGMQQTLAELSGEPYVPPTEEPEEDPDVLYQGSLLVQAMVPLDVSTRHTQAARAAGQDAAAAAAQRDATALLLSHQIASSWYEGVTAQRRLAILKAQQHTSENFVELLKLQFSNGNDTVLEILQQEQQLAANLALVPQAQAQLESVKRRLGMLLGISSQATSDIVFPSDFPTLDAPSSSLPMHDFVANRPDVTAALALADGARLRHLSAQLSLAPSVALTGQAGWQAYRTSDFEHQQIWSVGATVSMPLFHSGGQLSGIKSAGALERAALSDAEQTLRQALQEVEVATSLVQRSQQRLQATVKQVSAAEQAFSESRQRYLAGLASYLQVLTALSAKNTAELAHLDAQFSDISARIQLETALGGTWPGGEFQ